MSSSCAIITLLGNVGSEPEVVTTDNGTLLAKFTLAVNKKVKGEDKVSWFNVACFGKQAEVVRDWVKKGNLLMVNGDIEQNKWTDQNQQPRVDFPVVANRIVLMPSKKDGEQQGSNDPLFGG